MIRNLIIGGVAFGAAVLAAQQLDGVRRDVDRYNDLARMSGSPTLMEKLVVRCSTRSGSSVPIARSRRATSSRTSSGT